MISSFPQVVFLAIFFWAQEIIPALIDWSGVSCPTMASIQTGAAFRDADVPVQSRHPWFDFLNLLAWAVKNGFREIITRDIMAVQLVLNKDIFLDPMTPFYLIPL